MKYQFAVQVSVMPTKITVMAPIGWDYAEWDQIMQTLGIDQERVYFADYIRHPYGQLITLERDIDRVQDSPASLEQLSNDYFFSVSGEVPADPRSTG
jgi:hypothetical protein